MLFTRCPDCETTFRITAEALRKADGQVRCGRCACVFNAYNELRRRARRTATALPGAREAGPGSEATAPGRDESAEDEKDLVLGDISLANVIAELKASAATDDSEADEPDAPNASETREPAAPNASPFDEPGVEVSTITLLEKNGLGLGPGRVQSRGGDGDALDVRETRGEPLDRSRPDTTSAPAWVILDEPRPTRIAVRAWTIGSVAAGALLALQTLHHFRSDIAVLAVVGPVIQEAYAAIGTEIAPDWDLEQYEIVVDWDAVTQPDDDGQRNLQIAARIRNNGPRALPLPHLHVQLKDRWESTLGSRVFTPSEYLPPGAASGRMMIAGQTTRAELDILDPGPQAYGFELDVCVDAQHGALRCAADEVFR